MLQNKNFLEKKYIKPCNSNCSFCFLNYADILSKNYLFRNMTPDEVGVTIKRVHHQVKSFNKGDLVAGSGEPYNSLYILVYGSVVGEITDFQGNYLRIEELHAPDTIGAAFVFGDNNNLPVNVTAINETKILVIPKEDLLDLFRKNQKVMNNYLDIMANRAQHLSHRIKLLGIQTIKGKIAHYLLDLVKQSDNTDIVLKNTQEQIARMFGVTRPSLGRAIRELHDEGIINAKGKKIKIRDKSALSELLG